MTAMPKLVLSTPADILAAVPYLIGFHPADSLVVTGFDGKALRLSTRWDLPPRPGDLDRIIPLLRREQVTVALLVGYGPGHLVTPAVDQVMRLLAGAGIGLAEALRADEGRYWSYACVDTACCPAEGTPYDPAFSRVAAEAVMHGLVALPDRGSLRRSLEPSGGPAMREVAGRVATELRARLAGTGVPTDGFAARFVADGLARVRAAIERYTSGGRLDDDEAARLGFDLTVIRIRDEAWALLDDRDSHIALWRDLTRRLEPRYVAPSASLLAAAAWREGDCALASMAVDRALAADPGYSMAILLRQALAHLLPPAALRDRMPTPEEIDIEMGPPNSRWLMPLRALLGEEPTALAG
ncbi:DUF4192 domain-containing protein [Sphaerimonospora cavernae]|uniref:DUF4192 domain-containing protein n=1 Tax=Sphaerimonospora cavernae TaxID=1740611 RepID=A0ABV6TWT4_9ACTN